MLTQMPAPSSTEAATASRGQISTCQWNGSSPRSGAACRTAFQASRVAQDGAQAAGRVQERRRRARRVGRLAGVRVGHDPELVGEPAPARGERAQPVGAADRARVLVPGARRTGRTRPRRRAARRRPPAGRRSNGHELGVGVVERRAGRRPLVDRRQQVGGARRAVVRAAQLPGDQGLAHHLVGQLGEGGHVGGAVDHDLLARDRRELVRDDAHRPAGRVRRAPSARPSASTSGGVIASWPSQNGQVAASAIRVVRPSAPGPPERPGATMTGTPVRGLRRTSIRRRPFRAFRRPEDVDRDGQDGGRVVRARDLEQRLQVAQLEGDRVLAITAAASASFADAWNSPSAAITFARRSRSASAWRAIARCMPVGISTSFTSTTLTLMPHGAVCSSMICCRIWLILSRSDRSSSSVCWPSTLRSVVCEIWRCREAEVGHLDDRRGRVTTRKYATAFTRTGTLSRGDHLLRRARRA